MLGCNHAPLPGSRRRGSGCSTPSTATMRSKSTDDSLVRQPTQVRVGPVGPVGSVMATEFDERADMPVYRLADRLVDAMISGQAQDGSAGAASLRMSIRHPVSRAANRAFCPSLPMANDN
jgi:hypothetical protein